MFYAVLTAVSVRRSKLVNSILSYTAWLHFIRCEIQSHDVLLNAVVYVYEFDQGSG